MESAKMMVYDGQGGIGPCAVIVALFQLFEKLDDSLTHDNKVKASTEDLSIFENVNKLRMDRANMVASLENYQLIYRCVERYGHARLAFQKVKPDNSSEKPAPDAKRKIVTPRQIPIQGTSTTNRQIEIGEEYVLHHDYANEPDGIFDDEYDEYLIEDE